MQASELGKTKMVLQVSAITAIVLEHHYAELRGLHAGAVLIWLVVFFALISAWQYFWSFLKKRRTRIEHRPAMVVVRPAGNKEEEKEAEEKDVAAH